MHWTLCGQWAKIRLRERKAFPMFVGSQELVRWEGFFYVALEGVFRSFP